MPLLKLILCLFFLHVTVDDTRPGIDEAKRLVAWVEDRGGNVDVHMLSKLGRFEDVAEKTIGGNRNRLPDVGTLDSTCSELIDAGKAKLIRKHLLKLDELASANTEKFGEQFQAEEKETVRRFLVETRIVQLAADGKQDKALELLIDFESRQLQDARLDAEEAEEPVSEFGMMGLHSPLERATQEIHARKWRVVRAVTASIFDAIGKSAASAWIEMYLESVADEKKKKQEREWLLRLLFPADVRKENDAQRWKNSDERRWREALAAIDVFDREKQKLQWLKAFAEKRSDVPKERFDEYFQVFRKLVSDSNLNPVEVDELQWQFFREYLDCGNWDEMLGIHLRHNPSDDAYHYHEILKRVRREAPSRFAEFVEHLPDCDEAFSYNASLMDELLHAGYVAKAEANLESLSPSLDNQFGLYAKKVRFYRALEDVSYQNVDAIIRAYLADFEDAQDGVYDSPVDAGDDFGYFHTTTLGDNHLAQIFLRAGPTVALEVARKLPFITDDRGLENRLASNALGRCMTALIRNGKTDDAIELFRLATNEERGSCELVSNDLAGVLLHEENYWYSHVPIGDWEKLETVIPNDRRVIRSLVNHHFQTHRNLEGALREKGKARALELAERELKVGGDFRSASKVAILGWHDDLLKVAKRYEDSRPKEGYRKRYKNLVQKTADSMGRRIPFADADEAISFASQHFSDRDWRNRFLLDVANAWTKE